MIKFFRKIRYNLMEQNKTGKYFKYAIGEIALVMVGILLALQVNNWNEGRKAKEHQLIFILSVKEDLTTDRQNLLNIINIQNERYNNTQTLLKGLPIINDVNKASLDSLMFGLFYDNPTFFPTIGSYQSALSSGKLNQFENNEIINKIIRMYDNHFSRLVYNGEALDDRYFKFLEKYKFENRIKQLRMMTSEQNIEFQDYVNWYAGINEFYLKRCYETLEKINEIIEDKDTLSND
ncbi:DUF6090 family protein [Flavobacteriaceae bacterium S0862]|nr:DUF6090 family protein [Flavobacteriaceae bacterium S0862]